MKNLSRSSRGIALVIVLGVLVLMSGMLVAFMTTVSTERSATDAGFNGSMARQIADTTVNLVMAQVREATSQTQEDTTWASQPGAIHTFSGALGGKVDLPRGAYGTAYTEGSNDFVYKLYSADQMKVKSSDYTKNDLPAEVQVIESWNRKDPLKEYVDLNEPVLRPRNDDTGAKVVEPRYPILDPRAKWTKDEKRNASANPGIVEGFDTRVTGMVDEDGPSLPSGEPVPFLPMPVKWLYVLRDGTIGSETLATDTNPIVGRTAFWTDDESCKININTASEGTFWDTPSVSGINEAGTVSGRNVSSPPKSLSLAVAQPIRQEYQRYPGHPATTCLSPVLGWLWDITPTTPLGPRETTIYPAFKEAIYRISPFTPFGRSTSMGATRNADPGNIEPKHTFETKHLYATVDELLFRGQPVTGERLPHDKLTPEALEKSRFFLTANSRSPELNLFGRPRVTIWPVHENADFRTVFDDTFIFTSTIGKKPYGFTRSEAKSPTRDMGTQTQSMLTYLKWLTGGESGGNERLFPGFGRNFMEASKYGYMGDTGVPERDQILTAIYDYCRSVNLVDTGTRLRSRMGYQPFTPFFGDTGYNQRKRSTDWSGQVTPIETVGSTGAVTTRGMGRFVTVAEAALVFAPSSTVGAPAGAKEAVLLLEMATTMPGYPALRDTYFTVIRPTIPTRVQVGAGEPIDIKLCGEAREVPQAGEGVVNIVNMAAHDVGFGRGFMPTLGFANQVQYYPDHKAPTDPLLPLTQAARNNTPNLLVKQFKHVELAPENFERSYARGKTVANYPYISKPIVMTGAQEFTFYGGEFIVEIWNGEAPDDSLRPARLVQTINLKFPPNPVTVQVPTSTVSFGKRIPANNEGFRDHFPANQDVIRTIEFTGGDDTRLRERGQKGDLRLAMTRAVVPAHWFQPRGGGDGSTGAYATKTRRAVHGLQDGHGDIYPGYLTPGSTLANGGTLHAVKYPMLPAGITTGVKRLDGGPGDWDRGLSKHMDGAFGNKVDEGNVFFDPAGGQEIPYYRGRGIEETGQSFFSPNRQLSSPVMFGSIPSGAAGGRPWQTLLFRPDRETGPGHPGAKGAPDHLLLDLFHLPVVEPYAISEPFSTAGKINMNYVIAPFGYASGDSGSMPNTSTQRSYIRRDTGLRAVLKAVKTMAVPTKETQSAHQEGAFASQTVFRRDIDLDRTIEQFETRLKDPNRGLFRSTSEICELDLYPKDETPSDWRTYWDSSSAQGKAQTGDNMRERPYSHIYPRLTTKSNVFTVHMRCQAIRKAPGKANEFDEKRDRVVSEYRGSAVIERYVDPNDKNLENYDYRREKIEPYYRYRVVATKHFAPR